jgi:hypothetical protein
MVLGPGTQKNARLLPKASYAVGRHFELSA